MADYIGRKLGNYRIVRLIGRGGFANVYQGEHIYLKTPAAIKVLKMQLINEALENFLQEARIIASLEHPHIVRVLEFGVEGITPFLVMSYANNGTMRQQYPKNSILSWSNIISSTKQVADALQYAHDHGVIHRDVKPENMLLDKNHHIQLSDFGLAVMAQNMNVQPSSSAGTTAYMAPEQLQGQPCRASDQYALGIVVYEWLCGSLPFTGAEREITIQHLYTPPPSLRTKAPDISPAIEQAIMKTLAKDPQERFASIQEFVQALEDASVSERLFDKGVRTAVPSPLSTNISSATLYEHIGSIPSQGPRLNQAHQQGSMDASSPSNFLPQLPLIAYESTLTNNGRILQPSLSSSNYSLEEPSLPATFSSEDGTPQSSENFLPPHTPLPQQFSDLATPAFLPVTQKAGENPMPLLPEAQISTTRRQHTSRHAALTALVGITIIGLIIVAGMVVWTKFTPDKVKSSLAHLTVLSTPSVHTSTTNTSTTNKATPTRKTASTSASNPPTGNAPTAIPQPGTHSGSTPQPGNTPVPVKAPTPVPTSASVPTPTPIVPLTVALVNPPDTATAGSTITIVTQSSRGGVTISLDGKVRHFGQLTADSQGIATFQVKIPLKANRIFLTATATASNGDQAQSATQIINVE